jgi:hypothetical protein
MLKPIIQPIIQPIVGQQSWDTLPAPAALSAEIDETTGGILLTASEVTGADSYTYYVSIDGGAYTEAASGQDTTYTFTPIEAGSYSFGVTAVKGSSESAMTTTVASGLFTDVPDSEGIALMAFYEATGGDSWTDNTNWMTDPTVGNWYGVTVSGGHVTALTLPANNLVATASAVAALDLSALPYLADVDLSDNGFSADVVDAWLTVLNDAGLSAISIDLTGNTAYLISSDGYRLDTTDNKAIAAIM